MDLIIYLAAETSGGDGRNRVRSGEDQSIAFD